MKAFDTDVVSHFLMGTVAIAERVVSIPRDEQTVPIVVLEEIARGRLNIIRQAQQGKGRITIDVAYERFQKTLEDIRPFKILPYTSQAEVLFREWKKQKIRGDPLDLRIAAICVSHAVRLISRNRRDFEKIPGLLTEFWD
jgi:tRNA(fMet)-specific endonuclease VapC